jgi:hypothetical protein
MTQLIDLGESNRTGLLFLFGHGKEVRHKLFRVPEDLFGALHILRQLGGNLKLPAAADSHLALQSSPSPVFAVASKSIS